MLANPAPPDLVNLVLLFPISAIQLPSKANPYADGVLTVDVYSPPVRIYIV